MEQYVVAMLKVQEEGGESFKAPSISKVLGLSLPYESFTTLVTVFLFIDISSINKILLYT